ncbi:hypothetical protein ABT336_16925 [Micromonospora sp. NPDC000207]|uniref:hypothetical protein n=1 Tax=Micromonospora sp. NPDC000207 TaxID=3154246 RepID=UPI00331A854F
MPENLFTTAKLKEIYSEHADKFPDVPDEMSPALLENVEVRGQMVQAEIARRRRDALKSIMNDGATTKLRYLNSDAGEKPFYTEPAVRDSRGREILPAYENPGHVILPPAPGRPDSGTTNQPPQEPRRYLEESGEEAMRQRAEARARAKQEPANLEELAFGASRRKVLAATGQMVIEANSQFQDRLVKLSQSLNQAAADLSRTGRDTVADQSQVNSAAVAGPPQAQNTAVANAAVANAAAARPGQLPRHGVGSATRPAGQDSSSGPTRSSNRTP